MDTEQLSIGSCKGLEYISLNDLHGNTIMSYLKCPVFCFHFDVGSEVGSFFHQDCFQKVVIKHKCDYLGRIEESKNVLVSLVMAGLQEFCYRSAVGSSG